MKACTTTILLASLSLIAAVGGCANQTTTDSSLERQRAIGAGRQFLLRRQQEDGSWKTAPEGFEGGSTAMAVWALLESGSSTSDPAVQKGLTYLRGLQSEKTYTISVRANAYQTAMREGADGVESPLSKEVRRLVAGSVKGAYTYVVEPKVVDISDQSNSHYAAMGVEAGVNAGQKVPAKFWKQVMRYWIRAQNPDGGWPYSQQGTPSTPTMTAAAVATLGLCADQLEGKDAQARLAIDRGLAWLAPRLEGSLTESSVTYYYFLTLDRLERLVGEERIGGVDVSAAMTAELLRRQKPEGCWEGSWGRDISTAYAVLVLARQE